MDKPRVYSYRRFSSRRQASGHSLQRQIDSARRWCIEHDLELDESLALSDLGISAYKGDNVSRGALSGFLRAVETGHVPKGSILLVESLDRLSRNAIPEASGLLTSIVRAGIRVVSMIDGYEWNNETINDFHSFLLSVVLFSRANEESSTKAKRVSQKFQSKRENGLPVVSIMHGPGWVIPRADRSGWDLDPDKAQSVRQVFALTAGGLGGIAIARIANNEGWVRPWRGRRNASDAWEHTAISRLLRDRRVLGEWQPHRVVARKLVPDGDPVLHYFPAVIDEQLWHKAQAAISTRQGPKRMQGIRADIFSGLVYCSCGKRMQRKSPSGRGTARYYCMDRIAGITQCPSIPEAALTGPVIAAIAQVEHDTFDANATVAAKRETLFLAESKVKDIEARSERLLAAIEESGHNPLVISRLAKVEKERTQAEAEVIAAREALAVLPFKPPEWGGVRCQCGGGSER